MKNTSWVWKEIRREKSAKIVLLAISFSFLVTVLMFIVSGTFIKNVQKQTEDIYGYFDHILYHAEQKGPFHAGVGIRVYERSFFL